MGLRRSHRRIERPLEVRVRQASIRLDRSLVRPTGLVELARAQQQSTAEQVSRRGRTLSHQDALQDHESVGVLPVLEVAARECELEFEIVGGLLQGQTVFLLRVVVPPQTPERVGEMAAQWPVVRRDGQRVAQGT